MGGFTRFEDGKDKGLFPDGREVGMLEGKIKERGEEGNA